MAQLCASFRREAGRVWNQTNEARRLGLLLSEETITETCLFNIAKRHHTGDIAVIPATKPQEAKHGADWEWWITRNGRGVGFRVQAKRLFPSGRYESLFKAGNQFGQLKKLISKAAAAGLQPLYCFYNYDIPAGAFSGYKNSCHHGYRGPSFWGCALALPQDVEFIGLDSISDLRDALEPWHTLVCLDSARDLPASVLAQVKRMARARSFDSRRRDQVTITGEQQEVPQYVHRLIELGRTRRDPEERARYLDFEFWDEENLAEKDVAGIMVADQRGVSR